MKRYILTLSAVLFGLTASFDANAQARGYLGKRTIVTYALNTGWDIPSTFNDNPNVEDRSLIRLHHAVNINYTVTRKGAVVGGIGFNSTTLPNYNRLYNNGTAYLRRLNTGDDLPTHNINTVEVYGAFRYYPRVVAPVGRYWEFGLAYVRSSASYDLASYLSENNFRPLSENEEDDFSTTAVRLNIELGATRIIDGKWVLEYGFRTGLNIYPFSLDDYWDDQYVRQIEQDMINGAAASGYFMIHLAGGFIF